MNKDTTYIDVDDEITSIIEKVQNSREKIVALVLPKCASMLQSVVNMKLLKRTADNAQKRIVLITSEAGLMPLAGAVGLHVAKTLQSKPTVPAPPEMGDIDNSVVDGGESTDVDPSKSVGELAGMPPDEAETIEVGNTEDTGDKDATHRAGAAAVAAGAIAADAKAKKPSKFKIPNFNKFRLRLLLAGLVLILLIVGWVWAFMVAPAAEVLVKTNASSVTSEFSLTADTAVEKLDAEKKEIPAKLVQLEKTQTEKVAATGQRDDGKKASGEVMLSLKNCEEEEVTIPAGTGVSSNNLTFIIQSTVTLQRMIQGSDCVNETFPDITSATVKVVAQNAGDEYNLGARSYQVSGHSNVAAEDEDGMSGGTSKITKIVSGTDIESAKEKIAAMTSDESKKDLTDLLELNGFIALEESFKGSEPKITASAKAGDEAEEVTVTAVSKFTMMGIKEDDLKTLIEEDVKKQIDTSRQTILDNGLDEAEIEVTAKPSDTVLKISVLANAQAGPDIDIAALQQEVAGKKKGEVIRLIKAHPGVEDVTVEYSPFWISTTPKKADKITITFEQPSNNNANATEERQ